MSPAHTGPGSQSVVNKWQPIVGTLPWFLVGQIHAVASLFTQKLLLSTSHMAPEKKGSQGAQSPVLETQEES